MELIGDLKKKVEAAESLDEAKKVLADAGMNLTDDELNAVSGGRILRPKIDRRGNIGETKTFRVTNGAGAPIWDGAAAPNARSQIGLYPFGTEFLTNPNKHSAFVNPTVILSYYKVEAQDGYPAGYVLTTDVTRVR